MLAQSTLIGRPKLPYSGIPFLRYFSGKPSARRLSRVLFLLLSPLKKYYTQTVDQEDLISIGTIGLIKGISSYKPEKNVRLATYAARCIENATLTQWHTLAICSQKKLHGGIRCSSWLPDFI